MFTRMSNRLRRVIPRVGLFLIIFGLQWLNDEEAMAGQDPPASQTASVRSSSAGPRWLAGDHHVHSRFSVGWDETTTPPTPILGGDATYPIPMNALMAKRFGLEWMVATDHGGPNHSKISHDHSYPELLIARQTVPEVVQFFGLELNSPGADHSSIIVPASAGEADQLSTLEHMFDTKEIFPKDSARDTGAKMIEALKMMDRQSPRPVVMAHHPSRSATGLGVYGLTEPSELRDWNDAAPQVAVGMEGAPGHQAVAQMRQRFGPSMYAKYFGDKRPRGAYAKFPTMGGFDQMTARLGGFWDSMLGEGRHWWITANSDSHVHWTDGGADFWPGEYSKTYVFSEKTPTAVLDALRSGRIFVTTGDLVSALDVTVDAEGKTAMTGGTLRLSKGDDVTVTISFVDPDTHNANGDNPKVERVDLIRGAVTGPATRRNADTNPTTRVVARFTPSQWKQDSGRSVVRYVLRGVSGDEYIRVRGTSGQQMEPSPDKEGESPWKALWFYSNPIFLKVG